MLLCRYQITLKIKLNFKSGNTSVNTSFPHYQPEIKTHLSE